jgi:hypothetical protein
MTYPILYKISQSPYAMFRLEHKSSSSLFVPLRCWLSSWLYLLHTAKRVLVPIRCPQQISQSEKFFGHSKQHVALTYFFIRHVLIRTLSSLPRTGHHEGETRRSKFGTLHLKFQTRHPKFQMRHSEFQMPHPKFRTRHPKFQMRRSEFQTRHPKFGTRHSKLQTLHLKF